MSGFMQRGVIMPRRERLYHAIFGMHSNIPLCCVNFFTKEWVPNRNSVENTEYWEKIKEADGLSYIPCHACFQKKKFNPLHRCNSQVCKDFWAQLKEFSGFNS
jgi:hypothetical protein